MITAAVGILGAGAVSAAEFEAAELYVPAVGLKQSAQKQQKIRQMKWIPKIQSVNQRVQ